jgi:low temperature requirement protein LtrA
MSELQVEHEQRVTSVELFFDLVFVFAFTQVTTVLSDDPTWAGLAHGLFILAALWWAWSAFAWLTNTLDPDQGAVWGALLVAMAAMFVAALAVPEAFGRHGVVFGVAFLMVQVTHLALYVIGTREDRDLLAAILRFAPASMTAAALIVAAGFTDGMARWLLWVAALFFAYIWPRLTRYSGWHVAPSHFAERHGLIVIIAIGESLVAIGVGARETNLGAGVIVAAVLGLIVASSLWLAYFDFFTTRGEQLLLQQSGIERARLARDAYTYLHLPMVTGIVVFAFALKETLADVGHDLDAVPAVCLYGGPALYLFAYVAVRFRVSRTVRGGRLVGALVCTFLIPVALVVAALVALTLLAVVWVVFHAYELIWWREDRARTRALRAAQAATRREEDGVTVVPSP